MDTGESTAARSLLLDTGGTGRLAQHPALGNEDDMAVGEFLLQFTGEPRWDSGQFQNEAKVDRYSWCSPLLNLVESFQLRHRDEDDNGLLATSDINLARSGNLEGTKLGLEFGDTVLQVDQSLSDGGFGLIGGCGGGVGCA